MNQEFSHEKIFWAHEIPTRKNFGPTKYPREKIWTDEGNTHEKKFRTRKIPTRLSFGPTKYPLEKILNPRNTHKGKMVRLHLTQDTHDGTRPTKFSTLFRNKGLGKTYNNFCYSANMLNIRSRGFNRAQYYLIYGGKC